jgi:hypothetical protein
MYGVREEDHGRDTGVILYVNIRIFCLSGTWWHIMIIVNWFWIQAHDIGLCIQTHEIQEIQKCTHETQEKENFFIVRIMPRTTHATHIFHNVDYI